MKLLLCLTLYASSAYAVLGEQESNIATQEAVLKFKSQTISKHQAYTTHNIALDGTTVKEYADGNGQVFAVSWQGIKTPDLSVLFGSYYSEFKAAREKIAVPKGQRFVNVKSANLVVNHGGHMRDLHGFAYIPASVPADLDLRTLQ
jgi:hypothetical protein